jgi:hypothetical protein
MKSQISAGINFALSGLPYWTMDIGGFCVEKRYEQAKEGSCGYGRMEGTKYTVVPVRRICAAVQGSWAISLTVKFSI